MTYTIRTRTGQTIATVPAGYTPITDRTFCGHEECDMEPCSGPIVRRDAIRADARFGLSAEASTLGLAPGEWPLVIRVPDRFGALLDFDRLSIDRDDDGDVMMVEYARHDRNRRFVIAVLND